MDLMEARRRVLMAQPHPVTLSGGLVHFQTDMEGMMQITGTGNVITCGKNLFGSYIESGGFNSSTGQEIEFIRRVRSGFIYLPSGTYTVSASTTQMVIVYIYSTSKQFLRNELYNTFTLMPYTFTLSGDRYIRLIWRNEPEKTVMNVSDIANVQLESGNAKTEYSPYLGDTSAILTGRKTVPGINNVFSDSGNITVTYWTH